MSYEFHCTNCGKTGYGSAGSGPMSGANPPSGWKTKWASSKVFCSNRCKDEFNNRGNSNTSIDNSSNNKEVETQNSTSENKSRGMFGGLSNEMFSSILSSADSEEKQLREAIDHITRMTFSSDPTELSNQLNELASTGASSDKFRNGKPLKKTCYEKMEFGIMKLRQAGASAEADFFEKKRKSIKPGWF